MSENPRHLESLLGGLRPAEPDPELQERVAADLRLDEAWLPRQMRRAPRWLAATGWAGLGAAAAVAALSLLPPGGRPAGGGMSLVQAPVETSVAWETFAQPLPVSKVWSMERQEWIDAGEGITISPTLDPGRLLPVNFQ